MDPITLAADLWYDTDFWNSCIELYNSFCLGEKSFIVNNIDCTHTLPKHVIFIRDDLDEFYYYWCRNIYRKTYKLYKYFAAGCYFLSYYVKIYKKYKGIMHYDTDKLQYGFVQWHLLREINMGVTERKYDYTFYIKNNKFNCDTVTNNLKNCDTNITP